MTSLGTEIDDALVLWDGLSPAEIKLVVLCWAIEIGQMDPAELIARDFGVIANIYRSWAAPFWSAKGPNGPR